MDELLNIVKQIFGDYNGTVVIAILAIAKYVWPWYKNQQEENAKREKESAKREDTIIRLLLRSNILAKATLEALKAAGIEVTIPEITEGDI